MLHYTLQALLAVYGEYTQWFTANNDEVLLIK